MKKLELFELQNGDGEQEAIVISDIGVEQMMKEWYDYYWSEGYNTTDDFVKRMKKKGYLIDRVPVKTEIALMLEVCPC